MEVGKIFEDLESNQTHENEEAKQKLVELFGQNKEPWAVHYMMEYYLQTGSPRIIEVLVRAQAPHDNYIFDRLADWLKTQPNRVSALTLLSLVVRRHPTWLYKVEKHRLIKDILKLLMHEKDIVPLMSALLCIITLLPIIPNLVPNFLSDLFDVFGHLAAWNSQNPNHWPDDRIVHLQLGLQLLFHRLYGMYPCNFVKYLTEFVRRERSNVYHHTVKPLVETVLMHPLLVTATTELELQPARWKDMEPHDVVMDCAKLSLPIAYRTEGSHEYHQHHHHFQQPASDWLDVASSSATHNPNNRRRLGHDTTNHAARQRLCGPVPSPLGYDLGVQKRFTSFAANSSSSAIWSPCNSCPIPVTPTPAHMLPVTAGAGVTGSGGGIISAAANAAGSSHPALLAITTGSSPPEAAVEATPETTPLKDSRDAMSAAALAANRNAIRAIFPTSQPSSPLRRGDREQNQFNFVDVPHAAAPVDSAAVTVQTMATTVSTRVIYTQVTATGSNVLPLGGSGSSGAGSTTYDRRLQQILHDRTHSQSPFQTIEAQQAAAAAAAAAAATTAAVTASAAAQHGFHSPACNNSTPDNDMDASPMLLASNNSSNATPLCHMLTTATPTPTLTPLLAVRNAYLNNCCLHSVGALANGGCCHAALLPAYKQQRWWDTPNGAQRDVIDDRSSGGCGGGMAIAHGSVGVWSGTLRRSKSCSSIAIFRETLQSAGNFTAAGSQDGDHDPNDVVDHLSRQHMQASPHPSLAAPLQKSGKMLAIASATRRATAAAMADGRNTTSVASQTDEVLYERLLQNLLVEQSGGEQQQRSYDAGRQLPPPQAMLQQFLWQSIVQREGASGYDANAMTSAAPGATTAISTATTSTPSSTLSPTPAAAAVNNHLLPPITRDNEQFKLLWLQLEYERYCREVHAERIRRLMGRNRHKRSLEVERDRLYEQLEDFARKNKELLQQIERNVRATREREQTYAEKWSAATSKQRSDSEQIDQLRRTNEELQTRLNDEVAKNKELGYELEARRGEIFNLAFELKDANAKAEHTANYRDKLARLEAEFVVMGEVQVKCRDRLAELDNYRARDEEMRLLQDSYNTDVKEMRHSLDDKVSQLDSAKHKISELQTQLQNSEKVIAEQKRLLKTVKDEYEEKFKALNKKYEVLKTITMQSEEKMITMCMQLNASKQKPPSPTAPLSAHSPDTTDRTDFPSSVERNSPLSTSLASSESLSTSLRSTELRNLHQLVELTPDCIPEQMDSTAAVAGTSGNALSNATTSSLAGAGSSFNVVAGTSGGTIIEGARLLPPLDLASSANTATSHHGLIHLIAEEGSKVRRSPTATSTQTTTTTIAEGATLVHNFDITNNATTYSSH